MEDEKTEKRIRGVLPNFRALRETTLLNPKENPIINKPRKKPLVKAVSEA